MVTIRHRGRRQRGAVAVETAMVIIPLLMFMFGVFEYGRLLMTWNVLNNAAREGCRGVRGMRLRPQRVRPAR